MAASIVLDYAADAGCPDRAAFVAMVQARTELSIGDAGERVLVKLTRDGKTSHGELHRPASDTTRTFDGQTCDEVASLLAFALALALDAAPPTTDPAPSPTPVPSPSPSPSPTPSAPPAPPPSPPSTAPPTAWVFGAAATYAWRGDLRAAFGAQANAWVRPAGTPWSLRASLGADAGSVARASFTWYLATVDACVRAFESLDGCGGLEAGGLVARADASVADARNVVSPWVAPTLTLRWSPAWGRLRFALDGGLAVPLVRGQFVLDVPSGSATALYQAPPVTVFAGIGLGLSIP